MDTIECINNNIEAQLRGGKIRNLNWDKVAKHILEYGPNIMVYAGINETGIIHVGLYMIMGK
jgi:hypothetical protein